MSIREPTPRLHPDDTFAAFPAEAAAFMRQQAIHRCWRNGDVVLKMGERSPRMLTILQGRLRVSAKSETGEEVFFRWYGLGEIVGLVSIIEELPFPVDISAYDDCETLEVSRELLLPLVQSDALVAFAVSRILARHVWDMVNLVTVRSVNTLTERVFGVLRHLAILNGSACGEGRRTLKISQADIAEAVGASRQRVNLELRALEKQGRIVLGYCQVTVYV